MLLQMLLPVQVVSIDEGLKMVEQPLATIAVMPLCNVALYYSYKVAQWVSNSRTGTWVEEDTD